MRVTVRYSAQARDAASTSSESVELDGSATVRALLARVAELHGDALRRLVLKGDGTPQPALLVFVGDEQVRPDDTRALDPGAVVFLMTPISGG